jgi:PAS domain S-box-containing protein
MRTSHTTTRGRNQRLPSHSIIPKELIDLYPHIIFIVTREGTIVQVNKQGTMLLDSAEERVRGTSVYEFCVEDGCEALQKLVDVCIVEGKTVSTTVKLRSASGGDVDISLALSRYPSNKRTKRAYCVMVGRDVSEEKKKELDLVRFSNIAHYTVNPIEVTDVDGKIIYVNPAFEKASGFSKEEILGRNPNVFSSGKHPKAFWKKMWDTIKEGKVWVGEIENRRRSGEPFFTQLLISPILDGDGKVVGYFGVHRDITEQRYLQQQLIHAQKMESIGLLAAGIAHEVGNPLTSISSLVQVIQRATRDEFTHEKLEMIKSQITRISRIIRDLVDFSRRSSYEVQLTDVNRALHESVEIVRVGKKAKDIIFDIQLDESIPSLPLVADQIEQVFINVLINAVDAIHARFDRLREKSSNVPEGEVIVRSSMDDENMYVTIRDNGKGVAEEHLPKIFEAFFTTKPVGEGTGLGLWVSYGIIRSFRGNIKVESTVGSGTTITIQLPLQAEFS